MRENLRCALEFELSSGYQHMANCDFNAAYHHFERAHILGQYFLIPHIRSHWAFLRWGIKNRKISEIFGQIIRLVFGFFGSLLGWLPSGNTGGANVSSIQSMPVPEDLERLLNR